MGDPFDTTPLIRLSLTDPFDKRMVGNKCISL
jgi:hypothetical protein